MKQINDITRKYNETNVGVLLKGDPQKGKHNKINVGVAVFGDPQKGITLIALVITIIVRYDNSIKYSNINSFLLSPI